MDDDFGRYRLLGEISRGGHGIVHRAVDLELGRVVALKTIRDGEAGPVARERFLREARTAARLRHPNVVQVFEAGDRDGRPFYTMALLEGGPLCGPRPPAEACRLIARVASAAAYAHARGVIHRDLKPANIVLCGNEPVVTDFGIARAEGDVRVTETGDLVGTPAYMAPEQMRGGGKEADAKADVYALGAILFELLTGHPPFVGETLVELSSRVLSDPPPPLTGYDPALAALVRRCLAKTPAARPTAAELERELERWAPRRRVPWRMALALAAILAGTALWAASPGPEAIEEGDMAWIPGGEYRVGDPRLDARAVRVEGYWIDRDEAEGRKGGYSYLDALDACLKRGKRLPTEEEWEIATGGRLFPWGEEPDAGRSGCQGEKGSHPGDLSPLGCRDMAGNLAEWTATRGALGEDHRVVRGGHWLRPIGGCTSFAREELPVWRRAPTLGFRCARSVQAP